jgi:hypothetical protein
MAGNKAAPTRNTAPASAKHDAADIDDEDEDDLTEADLSNLPALPAEFGTKPLVAVATGFAPYIRPKKGIAVDLIPVDVDVTDTDFIRITCKYIGNLPLECRTGAKGDDDDDDKSTAVMVKHGELFSFSVYATLPLELGIAHATPIRVVPLKKGTVGTIIVDGREQPKKLWTYKVETTEAGKAQLMAEKARVLPWGPRSAKINPAYFLAFGADQLKLTAPPEGTVIGRMPPKANKNRSSANAEA